MKQPLMITVVFVLICASVMFAPPAIADESIIGLWQAHKEFGPEIRGDIRLTQQDGIWKVDLAGYHLEFDDDKDPDRISFTIPGERGRFEGHRQGDVIKGYWTQPPPKQIGQEMSSPVHFKYLGSNKWVGWITPRDSEYTFYMPIFEHEDGEYGAFLRNPDRNLGVFWNLKGVERQEEGLDFIGSFRRNKELQTLFQGRYFPDDDYFSVFLNPYRGGTYDFFRVEDPQNSHFYARGAVPGPFSYKPPISTDDGWSVSTLAKEKIRFEPLREMIEKEVDPVATSVHDFELHGVLIARHGKLVFEEYFHGFHRNAPHDTRSASKSMASVLVGAVAHSGVSIGPDTPVYATLNTELEPSSLEPRKQAMKLEHLLTMSSGFYCDDNDSNAPGNEETLQEQEQEPNWYKYTLALPMADDPGENPVYCSANTNLIGAVVTAKTNKSVTDLFAHLIAEPLGIKQYYLGLQPTGEVYLGGGAQWLPRDFMKLGQLMLNDGEWNGNRILSKEWVQQSIATQVKIGEREYGYKWWIANYPYKGRTVRAFYAAGNGGQIVLGIPELSLLVAFYGGNYSDAMSRHSQNVLLPEYILKAVDE